MYKPDKPGVGDVRHVSHRLSANSDLIKLIFVFCPKVDLLCNKEGESNYFM